MGIPLASLIGMLTGKGSMWGTSAAGYPAEIPIGADGKVLTADSGATPGVSWAAGGTDKLVQYDVADAAAGYLGAKTVAGAGISLSEGAGGDADKLKITCTVTGVTNGDAHDHVGGDGAQIDHGGLGGLSDNDHTQYILKSLVDAKGDIIGATANDTPARVAVGTDGQMLVADSSSPCGVRWVTIGGLPILIYRGPLYGVTGTLDVPDTPVVALTPISMPPPHLDGVTGTLDVPDLAVT